MLPVVTLKTFGFDVLEKLQSILGTSVEITRKFDFLTWTIDFRILWGQFWLCSDPTHKINWNLFANYFEETSTFTYFDTYWLKRVLPNHCAFLRVILVKDLLIGYNPHIEVLQSIPKAQSSGDTRIRGCRHWSGDPRIRQCRLQNFKLLGYSFNRNFILNESRDWKMFDKYHFWVFNWLDMQVWNFYGEWLSFK